MSPYADTALDQLRLAQDQLRHLDDAAETPAHQLLVFLAGAVVHAVHALVELEQARPRPGGPFRASLPTGTDRVRYPKAAGS